MRPMALELGGVRQHVASGSGAWDLSTSAAATWSGPREHCRGVRQFRRCGKLCRALGLFKSGVWERDLDREGCRRRLRESTIAELLGNRR